MGLELSYLLGHSPLDEDEKDGLLIKAIATRSDLDEFEQQNIEKAIEWTLKRKFKKEKILSEKFVKDLHQKMFGEVWKWAGEFRKTNKNLGVDKHSIAIELKYLLDDCRYWIDNQVFNEDEIATRFNHRIVNIHPFPNGNGRHSRLIADVIISHIFHRLVFSWGGNDLVNRSNARTNYLEAIWAADKGNIQPLLLFARS
jgi:Fic-DOC domain mobile mystery protein B